MLYVGMVLNIDPDDRELVVGSFDDAHDRAEWSQDRLPGILRELNSEIPMGDAQGIEIRRKWFIGSFEPIEGAIRPEDVKTVIRRTYHDIYVAQ